MAGKEELNNEVFVVSAIGADDSPQRVHADWLLEGIVDPVFKEHFPGYKVLRADRIGTPGLIDAQIIGKLLTARLVIADLTFLNPNAFYEIGIRHVVQEPIVHVHRSDQTIPFDVSLFRSMPYSTDRPQSLIKAQQTLKEIVAEVFAEGYEVTNPVTQARGHIQFKDNASTADQVLAAQMTAISERLSSLEQQNHAISQALPVKTNRFFNHNAMLELKKWPEDDPLELISQRVTFSVDDPSKQKHLEAFVEGVRKNPLYQGLIITEKGPLTYKADAFSRLSPRSTAMLLGAADQAGIIVEMQSRN